MPRKANKRTSGNERGLGSRIRVERTRRGIGVREFSRRVEVSASLISQIELGGAMPSVGTLYAIARELGVSVDELVNGERSALKNAAPQSGVGETSGASPVVHEADRMILRLASGVVWERLTPASDSEIDFLFVRYDVGGASCAPDSMIRHPGKEYGLVLTGTLGVTLGFDTYTLASGDSIAFESTTPHRLYCVGEEGVEAIWCVVGRESDVRLRDASADAFRSHS